MGRLLERADKSSRLLDVKYFMLLPSVADVGTPLDDIQWAASGSGKRSAARSFSRRLAAGLERSSATAASGEVALTVARS
jgi:uncharacterized alpha-E superfamily protein